jgi:hypothetical protein
MIVSFRELARHLEISHGAVKKLQDKGLIRGKKIRTTKRGAEYQYNAENLTILRVLAYLTKGKKEDRQNILEWLSRRVRNYIPEMTDREPKHLILNYGESEKLCGMRLDWIEPNKIEQFYKDQLDILPGENVRSQTDDLDPNEVVQKIETFDLTELYLKTKEIVEGDRDKFRIPTLDEFELKT